MQLATFLQIDGHALVDLNALWMSDDLFAVTGLKSTMQEGDIMLLTCKYSEIPKCVL